MTVATLEGRRVAEPEVPRSSDAHPASSPDPLSRWVLAGLGSFFLLVTMVQAPGLIVDDTKLPVVMAPLAWMRSSLHLWSLTVSSGSVQDQTFGYLFPMAPFFALTHLLHVPVWWAERIWLALLLTAGSWGVVRLAEALGIGKRWAAVLGGIVYCAAPIVVTWAASSATLLAVMLLPWLLQPLVVGSSTGSPRTAAARSGVAVALMGARQRHGGPGHAARRHPVAPHPPARATPAHAVRLVGGLVGPGLLLVGGADTAAGQVRLQLRALHRVRGHHHLDGLGLRGAAGRLVLDRLLRPGGSAHPRSLDAGHVGRGHPRDRRGHRPGTGRPGPADPRTAVPGGLPQCGRGGHRCRLRRRPGRSVLPPRPGVAPGRSGPAAQRGQVLARRRPPPGPGPGMAGVHGVARRSAYPSARLAGGAGRRGPALARRPPAGGPGDGLVAVVGLVGPPAGPPE